MHIRIPEHEYAPFHLAYLSKLPEGEWLDILKEQTTHSYEFYYSIPADKENYAYESGKWTVKQVLGHIIDTERIMSYRAMRISRNDSTSLPGFDQDLYAKYYPSDSLTLAEIMAEYRAVRLSTYTLFSHLTPEAMLRKGQASGHEVSVRALLGIIAGHEIHHIQALRELYGLIGPTIN